MKVSVVHHELSFRSGGTHGSQPLGNLCRQYLAVDSASMEALTSQDQNQKQNLLCWNHLGSDSSIDPFHPDGTLLPILNSDDSKLSPQADSQMDEENHLQPLIDRGPAELSQKQFCLAEVNPTSFEVTPCHHHEHRELHHEQAINLCYPTGNHVQSLSSLPADVDLASSDGEPPLHPTLFISERHCERPSSEEAPSIRVRLMCSFGGRIIPRPIDGKLRYAGGETRIVTVTRGISFAEFMSKMAQFYGSPLGLKYQLPDEDLDALVSVSSDDDLQNMMEEYDKIESGGTLASRLRLFFFSSPAEVEVSENGLKMELEDGCAFLEQRYVDAINGVPEKLHGSLLENDVVGFRQADALNNVDNSGRMPLHDLANVTTHSKGPSVPSSFPSSPPLAPRQEAYGKPPALGDISLQSLNERLSKVTISSSGFEGDFDQDGSGSSSSTSQHDYQYHQDHQHHEQQFYVPADSPRVTHHDLSVSRGDNWPGMCCIDSQTKLARQSEQYMDYRTSACGPMDQWHDMQQPSNTLLPQVEHQRFVHQHKHIPQKKHHHQHQHQHQHHHQHRHRHQQAWQLQIDGETGRSEHCVQDMYKQPQAFHQPHHPPACHCSHQIVAAHDGSSWNTEHHATPLFFQGSTQNHPQIPHGLAPAPPYQMGSAPSSPRDAVHDYQGKCACGLQHSQVHRGITVSIGDQFHNRWLPHSGDHPSRRHGLLSSSRFCDNVSYCAHSSVWQQPSHVTGTDEAEHREQIGNPLQHFHARHPMDCQLAECQARSRVLQYCEPPSNNEGFLPSHDWHETNKRCLSICSHDNRNQPMENTMIHSAYPGMQDQVTEWVSNQKGFQLDSGRVSASRKDFPRISLHKDEDCRGEFADEKCIEGELELYLPLKPGDFELRRAMETPIDGMPGMPYARKPPIPAVSVIRPLVSEELLVSQPLSTLAQGGSEWHPKLASLKTSAEVPNSWSMTSLEPGVCADLLPSWHGQASNRLMEEVSELPSSKEMPRSNFDSSFLLVVEGANNSIQTGRFLGKTVHDHGACTSESWEDYGQPSAARRAAGEALEPLPASSSGYEFVDAGCDGVRVSATHGDAHLLSPDVIPLGSLAATAAAPHMQQAIPAATLTMNTLDDSLNTPASPIYDLSPLSSTNATDFSFVPSKTRSPPAEANIDNEAFASHMSVTELLADGMISSVLKSCSNEGFLEENKDVDQQVAATDSHQEPNHLMCENGMEKDTRSALLGLNSLLPSVIEQGKGWSVTEASTVNGWLKVGVQEEKSEEMQIMQSDVTKKTSYKDKDSEVENSHVGETKEPALSQAESEAIARGLQIIRNSDLEDLKELGSGTFGTVYHGKWRGSDVAIKRIKASCFTGPPLEQERMISDFWKEACTLGQLHHPNVVAFYGVVPDGPGGTLATVTEYMVNGSLKQVLHKKDRTIDRRKRLFIAMDAAFGMEYLHSKNIVHFDLKCENLLVNMRDAHRPICKVGDFGLSKVKHQTLVSGGVRGTLPWMAPELLSGNCLVTEKIDVFSFGVVMWELLTGEEPYANLHCGAIISGIVNNTLRPSIPSWCDPRWRNLMEQCWSGNPAERPAFAEVSKELREIYASMNIK